MVFECGPVQPAEIPRLRDLLAQTFRFPTDLWDTVSQRVNGGFLVVRRDGAVVGGLATYTLGQWFGGKRIAMDGIGIVGVAPEARASGAAFALMQSKLEAAREHGVPLSALFASTQRLYRKVGYEQAGSRIVYELPLATIGTRDHELAMHAIDANDLEPIAAIAAERARRSNGNLDRSPGMWERLTSAPGSQLHAYLVGDPGAAEGFVLFTQTAEKPGPYQLMVRDMAALTGRASRRLWSFFSDHRSYATTVTWAGPANEPLLLEPSEQSAEVRWPLRWLLRIVDVEKALAQRGYPGDLDAELHLEVTDDLLEANSGRYVLRVTAGEASVERGGRGYLRTDIRGLAPLFSGLHDALTLRTAGRIEADDEAVATAVRVFAGPEPWFPDMF